MSDIIRRLGETLGKIDNDRDGTKAATEVAKAVHALGKPTLRKLEQSDMRKVGTGPRGSRQRR